MFQMQMCKVRWVQHGMHLKWFATWFGRREQSRQTPKDRRTTTLQMEIQHHGTSESTAEKTCYDQVTLQTESSIGILEGAAEAFSKCERGITSSLSLALAVFQCVLAWISTLEVQGKKG